MKTHAPVLVGGFALLALSIGFLAVSSAGDDKDVRDEIQKIANLIEKGDAGQAKKLAAEFAKSADLEDVMNTMGLRKANVKKPVFGYGNEPGKMIPDGIEQKLINLGKKAPSAGQLDKEVAAIQQMAYRIAAIADIANAKAPEKDQGQKKKKDWIEWTEGLRKSAEELAKAAKSKNTAEIKTTALKVNSSCNNCHGTFRD